MGKFRDGSNVGHGDRLAASHIHSNGQGNVWDAFWANFVNELLELIQIYIPFKGVLRFRVVGFVNDYVAEGGPVQLLVGPGGCEVHVARNIVPWSDEYLREDVLSASPLVGGDYVLETI